MNLLWLTGCMLLIVTGAETAPEVFTWSGFWLTFLPVAVFATSYRIGVGGLSRDGAKLDWMDLSGNLHKKKVEVKRNVLFTGNNTWLEILYFVLLAARLVVTAWQWLQDRNALAMDELKAVIARAARMKWSVQIQGETGTGKDLVAQSIHFSSDRSHGPFVPVNCAGLSEELLVSELFGHERGSFTGAFAQQKGKFELAAGGTLFLDEIGELSLPTQAKLLRALQDHKIDRLGGRHPIPVDVRVIAATNRELAEAVGAGVFREDLLFRLKSLTIRTPPLRERREDILVLARYFLTRYSKEGGGVVCEISPETESILEKHDWPGNVRELQNAMQHVVAFADHELARPEDLPELRPSPHRTPEDSSFRKMLDETKRHLLEDAVIRTAGNYKEAALRLGLNPKSIHRYLKTYNLSHLLR